MAREGLRVLVVSKKSLTEEQYQDFEVSFCIAASGFPWWNSEARTAGKQRFFHITYWERLMQKPGYFDMFSN